MQWGQMALWWRKLLAWGCAYRSISMFISLSAYVNDSISSMLDIQP
jgi:hypothetical protein